MPEGVVRVTGAVYALLASSSKTTSSGSSTTFIIFLVLIAVVGYFLLIRPQKQKQRRQREQQSQIGVGDDVLTVGGIVGKVVAVDADRVTIVSGGDTVGFQAAGSEPTRLVLVRNAIARKIEPPVPSSSDDADDAESDTDDDTDHFGSHLDGHDSALNGNTPESTESTESTESEGTSP